MGVGQNIKVGPKYITAGTLLGPIQSGAQGKVPQLPPLLVALATICSSAKSKANKYIATLK